MALFLKLHLGHLTYLLKIEWNILNGVCHEIWDLQMFIYYYPSWDIGQGDWSGGGMEVRLMAILLFSLKQLTVTNCVT